MVTPVRLYSWGNGSGLWAAARLRVRVDHQEGPVAKAEAKAWFAGICRRTVGPAFGAETQWDKASVDKSRQTRMGSHRGLLSTTLAPCFGSRRFRYYLGHN